jgi:hypothetical protein
MSDTLSRRLFRIDAAGVLGIAAITAGAYFLGFEPALNAQAALEQKQALLEQQSRRVEDLDSRTARARRELSRLKEKLAATSVPLFPASDINKRLDEIARMCEQHGLGVDVIDPGQAVPLVVGGAGGKFSAVPIKLGGTGGFTSVTSFLNHLLARTYPDVEVRTLVLGASATDGKEHGEAPAASFAIELRWFAAPEGSGAPGVSEGSAAPAGKGISADAGNTDSRE